jgi:hypothetical protein
MTGAVQRTDLRLEVLAHDIFIRLEEEESIASKNPY